MNDERPELEARELGLGAGRTRRHLASDVRALKSQLSAEALKDRALDAVERSAESVALRALRRLAGAPRVALGYAQEHPARALVIGAGLGLICWAAMKRAHR